MKDVTKAKKIVESYGGEFVRKTKHGNLYMFPNRSTILISGTPSSTGWVNDLPKLLKKLGVAAGLLRIEVSKNYFLRSLGLSYIVMNFKNKGEKEVK